MLNSMMRGSRMTVGLLKFDPERRVTFSTVFEFKSLKDIRPRRGPSGPAEIEALLEAHVETGCYQEAGALRTARR